MGEDILKIAMRFGWKADNNKKRSKNNKNYISKYNLPEFPHAFQVISYKLVCLLCF